MKEGFGRLSQSWVQTALRSDEPMLVVDPARPAAREVLPQRFRLADPRKRVVQTGLDQLADPLQLLRRLWKTQPICGTMAL